MHNVHTFGFGSSRTSVGSVRIPHVSGAGIAVVLAAAVGIGIAFAFGTGHAPLYIVLLASSSAALVLPIVDSLRLRGPKVLTTTAQVAVADIACIVALPLAVEAGPDTMEYEVQSREQRRERTSGWLLGRGQTYDGADK
ncbi:hypothetical protein AB0N24_26525 [Arthrobacter sp. NPDC093128]|uniref:hypothetical protein n=1 Tax=Arthrobacter sp. NPDC093128 TaxID=3154979 RepID=UPI00343995F8